MNTPFDFSDRDIRKLVYIRPVDVADLPEELRPQAEGLETIYAVHSADGDQLALVANREMAFMLARQNDYAPVNVH